MYQSMDELLLIPMIVSLFADPNTQTTGSADLSDEMKTFYSDYLVDLTEPELVHDQFGQKRPIPQGGGKTIEFRKYDSLAKATTPITEGVTPNGNKLKVSAVSATVDQYGDYVTLSDVLLLTAVDNNLTEAAKLLSSQAGRTLDTVTREILSGGTNVQYGSGQVSARYQLVGGDGTAANNHYLTVLAVRKAAASLKRQNAKKINGYYAGVAHPDVTFDLMDDENWKYPHQYVDTQNIYSGEIGEIAGVRFVETTEAKIFHAPDLTAGSRALTVKTTLGAPGMTVAVDEAVTAADAAALAGRKIVLNGHPYTVASAASGAAGSASVTLTESVPVADGTDGKLLYPGEAGATGRDVYSTLILGENAYGVTDVTGGGLEMIIKPLGSGEDPLNQRATAGWKAIKTAVRLVEQYMVRVETASTFASGAN
ncbi:MAG: N4-gp56 family major capsid protein [Clostridiaceae bacterium]|nr:N4-gp56 family major capsid protein [Clostridiaceae bacterium]